MAGMLNKSIFSASEAELRVFIFRRYLLIVSGIYFIGALIELLVDFHSSSFGLFILLIAFPLVMLWFSVAGFRHERLVLITMIFSLLVNEIQLIFTPRAFHVMVYWIAIMPLIITVLVQQVRHSLIWIGLFTSMIVGHGIYLHYNVESYFITVYPIRFLFGGLLFMLLSSAVAVFFGYLHIRSREQLRHQNESLTLLKNEVDERNVALKHQHDLVDSKNADLERYIRTILELSRSPEVIEGDFGKAVEKVCSRLCETIHVSRVSYWSYNPDQDTISCRSMFPAHFFRDVSHRLEDFPRYGHRIKSKEIIAAKNVMVDQATNEFCKTYLKEHNVCSMLDSPLVINNQLVGIICCENIDKEHEWRAEEILLVSSLCDILTISYKALQNREYIEEIRVKNIELSDQTARINAFNEELRAINEHLEERVQERTRALEEQNEQLTEYAFINSHLLRAPLSRILGLTNLIRASDLPHRERELITHLDESARALDDIVHRISRTLDQGNSLTREELAEKK
jgi:hypothetical protein